MATIKLAIAEDSKSFRQTLVTLLGKDENFEVVLVAENGIDLLDQLNLKEPEIVIMDIQMPEMDGMMATKQITERYPHIKIIALSFFDDEFNVVKMYSNGVRSFIAKEGDMDELFKVIRVVHQGGAYFPEKAYKMIQHNLHKDRVDSEVYCSALSSLSQTELKVIWYVSQLKSVKEIAGLLCISPNTVNNHEVNIRHKLNLNGRNSLQQYLLNVKDVLIFANGAITVKK